MRANITRQYTRIKLPLRSSLTVIAALVATAYGYPMENSSKLTLGANSIITGVCDGLADKLTVGVLFVRVGFVFSLLLGFGLFAYLLLCYTIALMICA